MIPLNRADWPKAKVYDVVQTGPEMVDIVARHECSREEINEVAQSLFTDMLEFAAAGRRLS